MNFLALFLNLAIVFALAFWVKEKYVLSSALFYWTAFILKIAAAISLGLLYKYYYYLEGDTWYYFREASEMASLAFSDLQSYLQMLLSSHDTSTVTHVLYVHDRSFLFVKLVSVLCLISGSNYWICAVYFALISFFCSWFLYRQFTDLSNNYSKAAAVSLFFFPSILFWSSGLLKETLALSALYVLTAIFLKFLHRSRIGLLDVGLIIISIGIAWSLKYYWTAAFIAILFPSAIMILINRMQTITDRKWVAGWLVVFVFTCVVGSFAHPNFQLTRILEVLVSSYHQYQLISTPESLIHYSNLQPAWSSILIHAPLAFLSGLFRPFPWETHAIIPLLASVENCILFSLTLFFLLRLKQNRKVFVVPLLMYTVMLCIFLALSTPNFGTLSRYRVGFLPFFVFALLCHTSWVNYFSKWFSFFKK